MLSLFPGSDCHVFTPLGAPTIRAYGKQEDFITDSEKKVDFNQISYYPNVMANRYRHLNFINYNYQIDMTNR